MPSLPKTVPASEIASLTGLSRQRIPQLVEEGVIPAPGKKGAYQLRKTLRAIFIDQRNRLKGRIPGADEDRARRQRAEADTAELVAGEKLAILVDCEDMRLRWLDRGLEIRRIVESADYLKPQQKTLLLADLAKIKAPEVDE